MDDRRDPGCRPSVLLPLEISRERVNDTSRDIIAAVSKALETRRHPVDSSSSIAECQTDDEKCEEKMRLELEAKTTEFNRMKEQLAKENLRLAACVPLSNLSSVSSSSTSASSGPSWTVGKTNFTLPPTGKESNVVTGTAVCQIQGGLGFDSTLSR